MKNQRNPIRHHVGVILALGCLLSAVAVMLVSTRTPSAQLIYPSWTYTGNLNGARRFHTATLLPNGKILVAGGFDCSTGSCLHLKSAELYDPATGAWGLTGSLNNARVEHTATLLPSGKVMVVGGDNNGNSAELYDPASGTWSITGNLNTSRVFAHTATLLPNGKVLVAGGWQGDGRYTNSAELYDPASGLWSITGSLNSARSGTATLLPTGKVMVAAGENSVSNNLFFLNSAEPYDPTPR